MGLSYSSEKTMSAPANSTQSISPMRSPDTGVIASNSSNSAPTPSVTSAYPCSYPGQQKACDCGNTIVGLQTCLVNRGYGSCNCPLVNSSPSTNNTSTPSNSGTDGTILPSPPVAPCSPLGIQQACLCSLGAARGLQACLPNGTFTPCECVNSSPVYGIPSLNFPTPGYDFPTSPVVATSPAPGPLAALSAASSGKNQAAMTGGALAGSLILVLLLVGGILVFFMRRRHVNNAKIKSLTSPPSSSKGGSSEGGGKLTKAASVPWLQQSTAAPGWRLSWPPFGQGSSSSMMYMTGGTGGRDSDAQPLRLLPLRSSSTSRSPPLSPGRFQYVRHNLAACGLAMALLQNWCFLRSHGHIHPQVMRREFEAEVERAGRLVHANVVELLGYRYSPAVSLIASAHVPNRTVEDHLHGKARGTGDRVAAFDWAKRMRAAAGAAEGLAYAHAFEPPVVHGRVCSSVVHLDLDWSAKVGGFAVAGILRATHRGSRGGAEDSPGSGYEAPEVLRGEGVSPAADVYSFGVLLLELLTGRRPLDPSRGPECRHLITWARPLLEDPYMRDRLVDPSLRGLYPQEDAAMLCALILKCVQRDPEQRCHMAQAAEELTALQAPPASPPPRQSWSDTAPGSPGGPEGNPHIQGKLSSWWKTAAHRTSKLAARVHAPGLAAARQVAHPPISRVARAQRANEENAAARALSDQDSDFTCSIKSAPRGDVPSNGPGDPDGTSVVKARDEVAVEMPVGTEAGGPDAGEGCAEGHAVDSLQQIDDGDEQDKRALALGNSLSKIPTQPAAQRGELKVSHSMQGICGEARRMHATAGGGGLRKINTRFWPEGGERKRAAAAGESSAGSSGSFSHSIDIEWHSDPGASPLDWRSLAAAHGGSPHWHDEF
eukprot:jgi/Mesen1/4411/ME000225S03399